MRKDKRRPVTIRRERLAEPGDLFSIEMHLMATIRVAAKASRRQTDRQRLAQVDRPIREGRTERLAPGCDGLVVGIVLGAFQVVLAEERVGRLLESFEEIAALFERLPGATVRVSALIAELENRVGTLLHELLASDFKGRCIRIFKMQVAKNGNPLVSHERSDPRGQWDIRPTENVGGRSTHSIATPRAADR